METVKCIETRRSIRKFKAEAVLHETMQEIVAAAAFAPSWKNTQVTRYIVVENAEIKEKIADEATLGFAHNNGIIKAAPALVVALTLLARKTAGRFLTQDLQHKLSALQRMIKG